MVREKAGKRPVQEVEFIRRELRDYTHWQDKRLRQTLQELVTMEYIDANGSQGKTFRYQLAHGPDAAPSPVQALTTPEQLDAMLTRPQPKKP